MHTRHGLPTVELGEPGEDRRYLTALVLARGEGTLVRVGHTTDAAGRAAVGDRLLLVDHAGRSAAVLEVDAVEHTTIAGLGRPGAPVDHAHRGDRFLWAAPLAAAPDNAPEHRDPRTPVSCLGFHVVGHDGAQSSPGQACADAPRQEGLLPEE